MLLDHWTPPSKSFDFSVRYGVSLEWIIPRYFYSVFRTSRQLASSGMLKAVGYVCEQIGSELPHRSCSGANCAPRQHRAWAGSQAFLVFSSHVRSKVSLSYRDKKTLPANAQSLPTCTVFRRRLFLVQQNPTAANRLSLNARCLRRHWMVWSLSLTYCLSLGFTPRGSTGSRGNKSVGTRLSSLATSLQYFGF